MTRPLYRLVEHASGLHVRYVVVEDDRLGAILRAGPFWTKAVALRAVSRLKVERRHDRRRMLRQQRQRRTMM